MIVENENSLFDFKKFITEWNLRYPYDRFWRLKYKIPFGSEQHRNMNFIDMALDLIEDKVIKEIAEQEVDSSQNPDADFFNATLPQELENLQNQEFKVVKKMTQKELDNDFETLDLTQF